jgi:precorrin-3B C17-methyltransferase
MNKLYVIGIGPGRESGMTYAAREALDRSDLICGYQVYTDLIHPLYPDKPVLTTPMTQEIQRCRAALDAAAEGRTVAMVCSGDAGVYGMAGLLLQLGEDYPDVEIETVCGVTAALSGAAVLGAPLSHDFAVISLSDLLTPWELIERRLDAAAAGDFCIALYNPASRKRADYLRRACDILLRHKPAETVCGWVRNIGREGQEKCVLSLGELREAQLDMFCTVFIGSSATKVVGGQMVTPRGYERKA